MRCLAIAVTCLPMIAFAQYSGLYPDGIAVSRGPMPNERPLGPFPLGGPPQTAPLIGPVHCAAEYEPMDGLIMTWEGSGGQNAILSQLAREATSADGSANVYVFCDNATEAATVTSTLQSGGANMTRVKTIIAVTDTIWCRDFGPRYVYLGGCRAIVKHTYNRNRPNDNLMPFVYAATRGHSVSQIPLIHGGGNYHLDAMGRGWATRLIGNENPGSSESLIQRYWYSYQRVLTTITDPFPTTVDSTQHIDMWMQIIGDNKVVVSDWPLEPGSVQDNICDTVAVQMAAMGYSVFRTPAFRSGGTHYTYTNVVMCNGVVIIPTYSVGSYNAEALAIWQQALPNKRIVQVNGQALVTSAGVFHCVVMHVPQFLGGANPLAYAAFPQRGSMLKAGTTVKIRWAADDAVGVTSADLWLSTDGGATYPTPIVLGTQPDGEYDWTVPANFSNSARIRVVTRNAAGLTGQDETDGNFSIVRANGGGLGG